MMPIETMDQRRFSPSSFFYEEEIRLPAQRQVGFWKPEFEQQGMDVMSPGGKSVVSSPLEGYLPNGAPSIGSLEFSQSPLVGDQKSKLGLEQHFGDADRKTNISTNSWRSVNHSLGTKSNIHMPSASFADAHSVTMNAIQHENSLFSSSLSDIFNKKLALASKNVPSGQSADAVTFHFEDGEPFDSLEELEARTIGNLLPDDDDLLAGVYDDLECIAQPSIGEDMEDFDLFSSGGGMELGEDGQKCLPGQNGSLVGEHPYGEHPSRTLFVRNINSNVEDSELKLLFEQYGDIRALYTACKHRGFVMISYYDIRSARSAMRALQNKPLRRRKLDIHFSIPKDNPSERDVNQGTLVVFNLDSSVTNDDLCHIFGAYGEIKEIRETPHKHHHKFIEFYDVRAAEAALRGLNRTDIAGKKIKLEPSRPGGARRMNQFSSDQEQEEFGAYNLRGSPPIETLSGCFEPVSQRTITSSCLENGSIQFQGHGVSAGVPNSLPTQMRVASIGNSSGLGESIHALNHMKLGMQGIPTFHPHSLPEYHNSLANGLPYNSSGAMAGMVGNVGSGPSEVIDNRHLRRVGTIGHPIELGDGVFGSPGSRNRPLHGNQYMWNNSGSYHPPPPRGPMMLSNSPSFVNGVHVFPSQQMHGLPRVPSQMMNTGLPIHHHHVGSAPAVNPSLWDRRHAYAGESPEASNFQRSMVLSGASRLHPVGPPSHNIFPHGGNGMDPSISPNIGLHSPQQRFQMFPARNPMIPMPNSFDAPNERIISHRIEVPSQVDNKKQFELDIERILQGEDTRTTLMIKNIPNKYTSKMLLAAIDERHRGTYDFIYLPIDFKNKCNVGYAFINIIDPFQIVSFYQAFNGKKWEKFNSEKVASLAYARIQGKAALIAHFQNSSLMNEDKRCRPILFHSDGPNAGDQEPFPVGANIRTRSGKARIGVNEETNQASPLTSPSSGEESSKETETDPSFLTVE